MSNKYLLNRGATATGKMRSAHYRGSPLVQGDIAIPCTLKVTIPGIVNNLLVLEKYTQLVDKVYTEPKNKEIFKLYIHGDVNICIHSPFPMKIIKRIKENNLNCNQKDIQSFFVYATFCMMLTAFRSKSLPYLKKSWFYFFSYMTIIYISGHK